MEQHRVPIRRLSSKEGLRIRGNQSEAATERPIPLNGCAILPLIDAQLFSSTVITMVAALALLLPILAVVSQLPQSHGSITRISFPSFGKNNSNQLIYMGNASFSHSHGYIDLTPSPNTSLSATDEYSKLQNCIGRVLYHEPITVWPATFTTTFTLLVSNITGLEAPSGDGLAFIIVSKKPFLPDSVGAYLGLFDGSTYANTSNQLAIEFDTVKNGFLDPDDNHVGIDVKSMISDATASLGQHGINIKSGRPIRVRIDYDGWNKTLHIYATYADRSIPYASILNRSIDLSSTVPRSAYVGFSAATGTACEIQRLLDWNFSLLSLPESSLNVTPLSTPRSSEGSTSRNLKVSLLVGSIAVGSVLLGLSVWFVARTLKGRRGAGQISGQGLSGELAMIDDRSAASPYAPHRFSYKILSEATKNFSQTELLGTGGFGNVYRAILENRDGSAVLVAVKRLSAGSTRQGAREFLSEISTIGRLRHRNLVQLQGWCHESDELLLVYDYMPNGSLDKLFLGQRPRNEHQNQTPLNWVRRHKIFCGLASALLYLHEEWEQRVVHRDVKPSNVMLDGDFNARLGDFGLARLIEHDKYPAITTKLAGTLGYWAPECSYTGKATAESDVFSFGVVVLEVASGRRVWENEENLMDWVWGLYAQGKVNAAADPRLEGDFEEEQMKRALILGLACSQPDPKLRPSIREALQVLINPNEQLMLLPSSRPVAVYVVSPSIAPVNSSYSNDVGRAGSSNSKGITDTSDSTIQYGRLR